MAENQCKCDRFAKTLEEFNYIVKNLYKSRRSSVNMIPAEELVEMKKLVGQLHEQIAYHRDQAEKNSKLMVSFRFVKGKYRVFKSFPIRENSIFYQGKKIFLSC